MSPARTDRMIGELAGHADDLEREFIEKGKTPEEARQEALARLGDTGILCDEIFRRFAGHSFWGRHPLVSFALFPILAMALCLSLVPVIGFFLKHFFLGLGDCGVKLDFLFVKGFYLNLFVLGRYVLTGLCSWVFLAVARKYVIEMKSALISVVTLALLGLCLTANLEIIHPVTADQLVAKGLLTYGLGFGFAHWPPTENLVRFFAPFLLFVLFYARNLWDGYPGVRHSDSD
jgi:hypothetical protein